MPEFTVTVEFTKRHTFHGFRARDAEQAMERAEAIVEAWEGVIEAEAVEADEE